MNRESTTVGTAVGAAVSTAVGTIPGTPGAAVGAAVEQDQTSMSVSLERLSGHRAEGRPVRMNGVGLYIPENLSFDEWQRAGRMLSNIVDSSAWWLGDWLVFGKKKYADRYQRAIRAAGLTYQTLRNYAWVARRFELSRRRSALTFQHHAEVASLPVEEQDSLLDRAERHEWTTKQLRNALRRQRLGDAPASTSAVVDYRIEVPTARADKWHSAAERMGLDFNRWVWTMLDRAAEETSSAYVLDATE